MKRQNNIENSKVKFLGDGIYIEGEPQIILCSSVFYFRIPREEWRDRLTKVKAAGYNCIDIYFPWNYHEPEEGCWEFDDEKDVAAYLELAAELGLWIIARPGPYICSEWDMGSLPSYLLTKKNLVLRDYNTEYLSYVKKWYDKILPIFVKYQLGQGGTIIALQLENELDFYDCKQVDLYIEKLRDYAIEAGIEVPMVVCAGQCDIVRAGGLVEGVIPTLNLYPDMQEKTLEDRIYHYVDTFWREDIPLCITETSKSHTILRRELIAGAKFIAPYNQVGGTNFAFTPAVNNWGSPLSYLTHDYHFNGMINGQGECSEEYEEALLLSGLIHSLEGSIGNALCKLEEELNIICESRLSSGIKRTLHLPGGGRLAAVANIDDKPGKVWFTYGGRSCPAFTDFSVKPLTCPIIPVDLALSLLGLNGVEGKLAYSTAEIGFLERGKDTVRILFYTDSEAEIAFSLTEQVEIFNEGFVLYTDAMNAYEDTMGAQKEAKSAHKEAVSAHKEAINVHEGVSVHKEAVSPYKEAVIARKEAINTHEEAINGYKEVMSAQMEAMTTRKEAINTYEADTLNYKEDINGYKEEINRYKEQASVHEGSGLIIFSYETGQAAKVKLTFPGGKTLDIYGVSREEAIKQRRSQEYIWLRSTDTNNRFSMNPTIMKTNNHKDSLYIHPDLPGHKLNAIQFRQVKLYGMGQELGGQELNYQEKCLPMEDLNYYRGYGWYEGFIKISKEQNVLGYMLYHPMDILHVYCNNRYIESFIGGGTHRFISENGQTSIGHELISSNKTHVSASEVFNKLDMDGVNRLILNTEEENTEQKNKEQENTEKKNTEKDITTYELRLGVRCEIWGHSNFSDSRLPAMDIRSKKGIQGMAVITNREDITEHWCYCKNEPGEERVLLLSELDDLRPRIRFGSYNNPEQPQMGVYKKRVVLHKDCDALVLELTNFKSYGRVYVNGSYVCTLQPYVASVTLDQFSEEKEIELAIYLHMKTIQESQNMRILLFQGKHLTDILCHGADEKKFAAFMDQVFNVKKAALSAADNGLDATADGGVTLSGHLAFQPGELAAFRGIFPLRDAGGNGFRLRLAGQDVKVLVLMNGKMLGRLILPSQVRPIMKGGNDGFLYLPKSFLQEENHLDILLEAMQGIPHISNIDFEPIPKDGSSLIK